MEQFLFIALILDDNYVLLYNYTNEQQYRHSKRTQGVHDLKF